MYQSCRLQNETLTVRGVDRLDLARCFACGQSFRWKGEKDRFYGAALGRPVYAAQAGSDLTVWPCKPGEEGLWLRYFDLERDYAALEARLMADASLCACVPCAKGIRVLNQEPFETLITFILSANNNTKRIAGIVERLCQRAGERVCFNGREWRLFPEAGAIAALSEQELVALGAGYRAPYLKESARIIAEGYDLERLRGLPLEEARRELMAFPGVGPKVADCVLLFSLGHANAFPVDVWIGRAMRAIYFGGDAPEKTQLEQAIRSLGEESGIVQQYIFHYARQVGLGKG